MAKQGRLVTDRPLLIVQIVPESPGSKFEQFGLKAPPGAGFIENGLGEHCGGQHLLM